MSVRRPALRHEPNPRYADMMSPSPPIERKPRADAQRNRERILEIAKEIFTQTEGEISLEAVARQAGVGIGTLYRHFPTRDALLEGVYRAEVERLAADQRRLSDSMPPLEALRAWMKLSVDYIATKKIIAPALNSIVGGPSRLFESSTILITDAIQILVRRAVESGDLRADTEPLDLLRALAGVANIASAPDWQVSAKRLVDILLLGSRPIAPGDPLSPS